MLERIKRIYLDINGVCNRFVMHALEVNGLPVTRYEDSKWPLRGTYDFVAAASRLAPDRTWTKQTFWTAIPLEVWAVCPPSQEFPFLLSACLKLVGAENVYFVIHPHKDDWNHAGSIQWVRNHAPLCLNDPNRVIISRTDKSFAKPGSLLIDDSDCEVERFRRHGGEGLLVPRHWNSGHRFNTGAAIREFFNSPYCKNERHLVRADAKGMGRRRSA